MVHHQVISCCQVHKQFNEVDFDPLKVGTNLGYLVFSLIRVHFVSLVHPKTSCVWHGRFIEWKLLVGLESDILYPF